VVPFSRTLCPVSPSLQWVPRVAVPHLPDRCPPTDLRYYDPLRLPLYPSRVASLSLASRYLARFFAFVSRPYGSLTHRNGPVSARALVHPVPLILRFLYKEIGGSPKFPSYPSECMPCSRTPVVSLRLAISSERTAAFPTAKKVGFSLSASWRGTQTTMMQISRLSHTACTLAPHSFIPPLLGSTCASLPACWLGFSRVGFSPTG
jgi:hypothetical protein